MAVKPSRLGTQGALTHYRGSVDWCRPTVRHSWAGQTVIYMVLMLSSIRYPTPSVTTQQYWTQTVLCVQEVARAMLQQSQHVQHAGADLSAEELRFSTSDLLQALKVCMPVPWAHVLIFKTCGHKPCVCVPITCQCVFSFRLLVCTL